MRRLDSNGYREETIRSYRRRVKRFLRWVYGCETSRDPTPELLRCIKVSKHRGELPEGVLSVAEVQQTLAACESQRNRALVHVGYESGCRAGELLGLRIRDIEFDNHGGVILVRGKTGMRRIRLIESVHDLQLWLNVHPDRENPKAWLWPNMNGKPLTTERFNGILKAAARKGGINKRVYSHLLRHSRATHLAKVLTESQLRIYFGWTKTSDIPARYVHLSGRDVDDTLLKHYGVFTENEQKLCPRCGAQNHPGALYCMRCSAILSTKEAFRVEERRALEDALVAKVVKKLIELAPDLVERALRESEAIPEMEKLQAGVS